ncbi:hypothetical protein [Desulfoluna spongiiphila]|uniref:Uncharacterized protein n=1 Tax=Desulfoluna spongiiphila TaxID=419481 RepID=A0A1G5D866_9BACT|nr:hypothetical protein [Desulfoluna spongiiphila]SCY10875.1 hypothetical protein SAMN05216233_10443 [Desulfoluna spongiiphila]
MNTTESQHTTDIFSGTEIPALCDAIKDIHRLLKSVGEFLTEFEGAEDSNGNGLQLDFKKWGIRTITEDLLERQYRKIDRIAEIYREEQRRMKEGKQVKQVIGEVGHRP